MTIEKAPDPPQFGNEIQQQIASRCIPCIEANPALTINGLAIEHCLGIPVRYALGCLEKQGFIERSIPPRIPIIYQVTEQGQSVFAPRPDEHCQGMVRDEESGYDFDPITTPRQREVLTHSLCILGQIQAHNEEQGDVKPLAVTVEAIASCMGSDRPQDLRRKVMSGLINLGYFREPPAQEQDDVQGPGTLFYATDKLAAVGAFEAKPGCSVFSPEASPALTLRARLARCSLCLTRRRPLPSATHQINTSFLRDCTGYDISYVLTGLKAAVKEGFLEEGPRGAPSRSYQLTPEGTEEFSKVVAEDPRLEAGECRIGPTVRPRSSESRARFPGQSTSSSTARSKTKANAGQTASAQQTKASSPSSSGPESEKLDYQSLLKSAGIELRPGVTIECPPHLVPQVARLQARLYFTGSEHDLVRRYPQMSEYSAAQLEGLCNVLEGLDEDREIIVHRAVLRWMQATKPEPDAS